jgi:hypothetical protein
MTSSSVFVDSANASISRKMCVNLIISTLDSEVNKENLYVRGTRSQMSSPYSVQYSYKLSSNRFFCESSRCISKWFTN